MHDMSDITMHLRRFAQQDIHRHVDRIVACLRVDHAQLALFGRGADGALTVRGGAIPANGSVWFGFGTSGSGSYSTPKVSCAAS